MPKTLQQKRDEAAERMSESSRRSIDEQIALLDNRPGNAERERARLMKIRDGAAAAVAKKKAKRSSKGVKKVARG